MVQIITIYQGKVKEVDEEDKGILEEEQIEISTDEKLAELIMTSDAKEYLENFKKFKLTKENISILEEKINSANLYLSSNIDKGNKRLLKHFSICPDYKKFFKIETNKKETKEEKDEKEKENLNGDWRRLLPSQWREIFQKGIIPDYVSIVSEFALLAYISRMSAIQAITMLKKILGSADEIPIDVESKVIKKTPSSKGICEIAVGMHERGDDYHQIRQKLYPNSPKEIGYARAVAAVAKGREIKLKKDREDSIVVS